jgi:HD-GYP domain-containing protein (c-di-GMP phosphodiesterase class II)
MYKRSVPVADLKFGMYVAELDRPWVETPFAFQGFVLQTNRQLEALHKFCRHVFVDADRGDVRAIIGKPPAQPPSSSAAFEIQGKADYRAQSELAHEIKAAAALYSQTVKGLQDFVETLEQGNTALDGSELQRLVNALADTVIRNPDALLLVSKLREMDDPAHARALQVSVYMMVFGRFLQREPDDIRLLGLLGLLQDIGNTRLPLTLLLKHSRDLTRDQGEIVRKHVELSSHIIAITAGLPPRLANLVLLHHERQDGKGYPRALRGYQIGLHGSIAAICDAYETLLAPAPYGDAKTPSEAIKHLLNERGTAFHGPLLEQFVRCMGVFPVGSAVELSSGEYGVVVGEHVTQRLKPKVLVIIDRAHRVVRQRKIVDLAKEPELRIRRTLEQGQLAFDPRQLL